jgi:MFS family permease
MHFTTRTQRSAVRRLAFSRLISLTGSFAAMIALAFEVYRRTGSTLWVSAAFLATFGAAGIATPLGGALGDRFDRRRVMIVSDVLSMATFGVLTFVHDPGWMIGLMFVAEVVASPQFPAIEAAIPNLAGEEHLAWANGTIGFGRNVGEVVGPMLGGLLVATSGAGLVFFLNAASFALSAILVASVRGRFSQPRTAEDAHEGLRAGFVFVVRDRILRAVTLAWMVLLIGVGTVIVAELPLSRAFGVGSFGYGMLAAGWGVGALSGSLLGKRLRREQEPSALFLGTVGPALGLGLISVIPWFPPVLVCMAFAGVTDAISEVAFQNIAQRRTPDAVRSRVLAAMDASVTIALALSFVAAGPLVAALGPRGAYAAAGISALLGGAILLPVLRRERGALATRTGVAA